MTSAGHGRAGQGEAGLGGAWHGWAWRCRAWSGNAGLGDAWLGEARQGAGFAARGIRPIINQGRKTEVLDKSEPVILKARPVDIVKRKVILCGTQPIMFDRYAGDNNTKLEPEQKLYLLPSDSRTISLPAINIMSFLAAHNTNSAPKRLRDKRKYKDICNACLSFVSIGPDFIPLLRNGKPILFDKFVDDPKAPGMGRRDKSSGTWIDQRVARLDRGIPNPKVRPVVPLPWSIEFEFTLFPNREIKEQEIINLFAEGGLAIGFGTFRGCFGKFVVEYWA